jgi:hypothetical protein
VVDRLADRVADRARAAASSMQAFSIQEHAPE